MERSRRYIFGKILLFSLICIACVSIFKTMNDYNIKSQQLEELRIAENEYRIRNEELQKRVDAPVDKEYIENIAKEQLGYRYPNEILFYIGSEK